MPLDLSPAESATPTQTLIPLSSARTGQTVVIREVRTSDPASEGGDIGLRLLELGFVEGESVRIMAHGFPGREPIAVRIGNTTFALRRFEADYLLVAPAADWPAKT